MTTTDIDVFVGNDTVIDADVYSLWLNGYTAHEASVFLQTQGVLEKYQVTFEYVYSDVLDKFRGIFLIEKHLQAPAKFMEQRTLQMDPAMKQYVIEKYYEFNASVIREILGRKLSQRNRSALDDVSERTRVQLKSCRRQFDNVRRVFKYVEEMPGCLIENITSQFCLSPCLASQYAAIVFITNNRFETGRRKLCYLTFYDFVHCANEMIKYWSCSAKDCKTHEDMDQDLDQEFLHNLRDLKSFTDKENLDEHKTLIQTELTGKICQKSLADFESNFKTYSKNIINIAYSLNHSKELKDLFVSLVSELVDPWRAGGWSQAELSIFLTIYQKTATSTEFFSVRFPGLRQVWERYIRTACSCLLQLYHS